MTEIILQQAVDADIPVMIDIEKRAANEIYHPLGNAETFLRVMAKGPVFLVKKDNQTVGIVGYYQKEDGSMYISVLAIGPNHQRKGFARAAMQGILEKLKDAPRIWLVTHPDNMSAIKLYESLGFKITGRKENYFGNGQPRIILTLEVPFK